MHDDAPRPAATAHGPDAARRRLTIEVWIVLGLSLGQAGVYAAVRLLDRYTRDVALANQVGDPQPVRSPTARGWT